MPNPRLAATLRSAAHILGPLTATAQAPLNDWLSAVAANARVFGENLLNLSEPAPRTAVDLDDVALRAAAICVGLNSAALMLATGAGEARFRVHRDDALIAVAMLGGLLVELAELTGESLQGEADSD